MADSTTAEKNKSTAEKKDGTDQKTFIDKVLDKSGLQDVNDAQMASKIVFRIMRDLMPTDEIEQIEQELQADAPKADMKIADLWNDPNVMVAFFSRISPLRQLNISSDTFLLRLKQEGQLPKETDPKVVAKAVFSAMQDELPQQRTDEIAQFLPDEIRQLWVQG